MAYMLCRLKVEDYSKWESAFAKAIGVRQAAGSKGGYIFRNADDPNEVLILLECEDLGKFRQFMRSPELRERMQESGAVGPPEVFFLEETDRPSA